MVNTCMLLPAHIILLEVKTAYTLQKLAARTQINVFSNT